ncbi:MAG: response regulator [Candidatus Hydrogenedentes bacterium]|nr:response regulator [Candidatus Hydrogenedentota bacterium]
MARTKRVLVVDDDESARMFVMAIMEEEGWECDEAVNGEEGVDRAEANPPDLIILDIDMPVMDGFEAFQRLRDSPFTEKVPIIMLTGVNEDGKPAVSAESMETQFGFPRPNGFVDKPVDAVFLRNCVMGVVG